MVGLVKRGWRVAVPYSSVTVLAVFSWAPEASQYTGGLGEGGKGVDESDGKVNL